MTPEEIEALPYRPCVGVMLVNQSGQVFVGQRVDSDYDAWQMPQGGIDPGETPRDAALRELGEETGVDASLVRLVAETEDWIPYDLPHDLVPKLWKGRYRGQEQKWFLMRFHGSDSDVNITTRHQEFSAWRWIDPADLPGAIVSFKRHTYERLLEEFGAHL
ncbi:MAG: RNA pyrophosphohydrolase [Pseudomonadota bacterium]